MQCDKADNNEHHLSLIDPRDKIVL